LSDGLNIRTYLAICDWLNLPPSYFLVSSNDGDSTVTNADRLAAQVRQCVQLPRKAAAAIADLIEVTIHKRD
jgi:transglutaminase-like putative cysteine protease